jgi:multisubunit Na+/H+ antiporter MnhC subunit
MSIYNEHSEHSDHAVDRDTVVQWLMIAAIIVSGVAVTAVWLYLQWKTVRPG